ncbi:unnamed protein product [Penicillium bialowiezense]
MAKKGKSAKDNPTSPMPDSKKSNNRVEKAKSSGRNVRVDENHVFLIAVLDSMKGNPNWHEIARATGRSEKTQRDKLKRLRDAVYKVSTQDAKVNTGTETHQAPPDAAETPRGDSPKIKVEPSDDEDEQPTEDCAHGFTAINQW